MPKKTPGFVYVLFNAAMPELVKIGRTTSATEDRAGKLSRATGVPVAFVVVHEEWVPNCATVERALHKRFAKRRVSRKREFFRMPVKQAVLALVEAGAAARKADPTYRPAWQRKPVLHGFYGCGAPAHDAA